MPFVVLLTVYLLCNGCQLVNIFGVLIFYPIGLGGALMGYVISKLLQVVSSFIEKSNKSGRTYYVINLKGQKFISEFKKVEELSEAFGIPF